MTLSSKRQTGAEIIREVTAFVELRDGVSSMLAEWERGSDLYGEGAEKIVSWLLSHERIHEAIAEGRTGGSCPQRVSGSATKVQ